MKAKQAFKGIKVLDLTSSLNGNLIVTVLARHGATVITIESRTHPYVTRTSAPYWENIVDINRSGLLFQCMGNNYGMGLNLSSSKGLDVLRRLAKWADIIVESQRPGVLKKWGIDYDSLSKDRSDIILVSASLEGQSGPRSQAPGWGIGMKGLQGIVHFTGWPDRNGVGVPLAYADTSAPFIATPILLAALDYRRRTGKGQYIDFAQFEAALHFVPSFQILDYYANNRVGGAQGNRCPHAAPHGVFRCRGDDRWCAIAVTNDEEWRNLCRAMGDPPWTRENRFSTLLSRKKNEDDLEQLIQDWTSTLTAEQVMNALQKARVPAGVVQNAQDLLDKDPQLSHRKYYQKIEHRAAGLRSHPAWPFKLSETPCEMKTVALFGEHTEYICREILGMDDDEFVALLVEEVLEVD